MVSVKYLMKFQMSIHSLGALGALLVIGESLLFTGHPSVLAIRWENRLKEAVHCFFRRYGIDAVIIESGRSAPKATSTVLSVMLTGGCASMSGEQMARIRVSADQMDPSGRPRAAHSARGDGQSIQ